MCKAPLITCSSSFNYKFSYRLRFYFLLFYENKHLLQYCSNENQNMHVMGTTYLSGKWLIQFDNRLLKMVTNKFWIYGWKNSLVYSLVLRSFSFTLLIACCIRRSGFLSFFLCAGMWVVILPHANITENWQEILRIILPKSKLSKITGNIWNITEK